MTCYTYKELTYSSGIFDSTVDVTYILTMTNSTERHVHIHEQLKYHHPTSKVIIVFNDGYKNCMKSMKCGEIDLHFFGSKQPTMRPLATHIRVYSKTLGCIQLWKRTQR